MKGYKATKNMKCLDLTYVVGKTYSIDKLEICSYGFHFCQKMKDVIGYYFPTKDFVLLEVEALGEIQTKGDKSATDKLKVIRVVPREEYTFNIHECEYDSFGNKIKEISPDGDVWQYEYDSYGNRIKVTGPFRNVYQYEYDSFGNMIKITILIGLKATFHQYEYDSFGNRIKEITPSGNVFQYEYDSFGNMIKKTSPYGTVWYYEYDSFGHKIKESRPSGNTWNITIE
jgi:YD repeat-containing protein